MSAKYALVGLSREPGTGFLLLYNGLQVLGRSSLCDLIVNDASVSRKHASILVEDAMVTVTDLDSRNGTYLNEQMIRSCPVARGQELRFGSARFFLASCSDLEDLESNLRTDSCLESNFAADSNATKEVRLSQGQIRIFDLLVTGLAEKQIASQLGISNHTVHNHVKAIYRAYAVHSRSELLALLLPPTQQGPSRSR
jgi:DNA-binding CsgD family transcriptional regulator